MAAWKSETLVTRMDYVAMRKQLAAVLRELLFSSFMIPREQLHRRFMDRLSEFNEDLYDASRSEDRSLNAAWNFCDDYFDAVVHGYKDCAGIPIGQAKIYLEELAIVLARGEEVQNLEILRFFRNAHPKSPN